MRILIIEDAPDKRRDVRQALETEFLDECAMIVDEAVDYEQALERLGDGFYDLVVLDLFLPSAMTGPSEDSSKALIRQVLKGSNLHPPTHIIGLTAYLDRTREDRIFYDENLLALIAYDAIDGAWRDDLCSRIRYLLASKRAAARFRLQSYDFDVVVLTARHENEYVPVRIELFDRVTADVFPLWPGRVTIGESAGPDGRPLKTALVCVGEMGMAATAAVASEAVNLFRPRLVAMLGMCCGFSTIACNSPRKLGDILVARETACWEEGKYVDPKSEGEGPFKTRAKTRTTDDGIRGKVEQVVEEAAQHLTPALTTFAQTAEYVAFRRQFKASEIRAVPEVRYAPVVSGSSVVADESVIKEILDRHPQALGLDMEIAGLHVAVERGIGRKPSVLAIKGVADFGRADKGDEAQVMAARLATKTFRRIVPQLEIFGVE